VLTNKEALVPWRFPAQHARRKILSLAPDTSFYSPLVSSNGIVDRTVQVSG